MMLRIVVVLGVNVCVVLSWKFDSLSIYMLGSVVLLIVFVSWLSIVGLMLFVMVIFLFECWYSRFVRFVVVVLLLVLVIVSIFGW